MKILAWIIGALLVLAGAFYAFNSYIYHAEQAHYLAYQNATYGYSVEYQDTLQVKEYIPEDTVFGFISGDTVDGVAEARVMTVQGNAGESFDDAVARQLENLCAADGPTSSFSCTGVSSKEAFTTAAGLAGTKIFLNGVLKDIGTASSTAILKGPYYVFMLGTGATASQVLVIHAPLNKSAAEADTATIEELAKSLKLSPSNPR